MSSSGPLIHDVSDTARWAAVYRARESERPDALFHDPLARRLAGEQASRSQWRRSLRSTPGPGPRAPTSSTSSSPRKSRRAPTWSSTWRPVLMTAVSHAAATDLAVGRGRSAGTDGLQGGHPGRRTAGVRLERIRLDLAQTDGRRGLFQQLGSRASRSSHSQRGTADLPPTAQVAGLAENWPSVPSMRRSIVDLCSPGLYVFCNVKSGVPSARAAPAQFAPEHGPAFFRAHGFGKHTKARSMKTAASQTVAAVATTAGPSPGRAGRRPQRPSRGSACSRRDRKPDAARSKRCARPAPPAWLGLQEERTRMLPRCPSRAGSCSSPPSRVPLALSDRSRPAAVATQKPPARSRTTSRFRFAGVASRGAASWAPALAASRQGRHLALPPC